MSFFEKREAQVCKLLWETGVPDCYNKGDPLQRVMMIAARLIENGHNFAITNQNGCYAAHFEVNGRIKMNQSMSPFDCIFDAACRILNLVKDDEEAKIMAEAATASHPKPKRGAPRKKKAAE
jgi:hypothetical protein